MPVYGEDLEIKAIKDAIEDQFWTYKVSRLDVVLLPLNDVMGIFYVTYTVEYADANDISAVGLEKGIYTYNKEAKILEIQIDRFKKQIALS